MTDTVLVVGAGPVGLTAACQLARLGRARARRRRPRAADHRVARGGGARPQHGDARRAGRAAPAGVPRPADRPHSRCSTAAPAPPELRIDATAHPQPPPLRPRRPPARHRGRAGRTGRRTRRRRRARRRAHRARPGRRRRRRSPCGRPTGERDHARRLGRRRRRRPQHHPHPRGHEAGGRLPRPALRHGRRRRGHHVAARTPSACSSTPTAWGSCSRSRASAPGSCSSSTTPAPARATPPSSRSRPSPTPAWAGGVKVRNPRWLTYFEVHHAQVPQLPPRAGPARRRRRAHPQPGRGAGHEHRHPGRRQPRLEARAGRAGPGGRGAARHLPRRAPPGRRRGRPRPPRC